MSYLRRQLLGQRYAGKVCGTWEWRTGTPVLSPWRPLTALARAEFERFVDWGT